MIPQQIGRAKSATRWCRPRRNCMPGRHRLGERTGVGPTRQRRLSQLGRTRSGVRSERSRHRIDRPHRYRQGLPRRVQQPRGADARVVRDPARRSSGRASIPPAEVDDVVIGAAGGAGDARGTTSGGSARLPAGLPVTGVFGMSVDCQCASGLMAVATAAKAVVVDGMPSPSGAGSNRFRWSRSKMHRYRATTPGSSSMPELYMSMLETAEVVAKRYEITRERAGRVRAEWQSAPPRAQAAGQFDAEIAPLDLLGGHSTRRPARSPTRRSRSTRRGHPRGHDARGPAALKPVLPKTSFEQPGEIITAGNACNFRRRERRVLMEASWPSQRNLTPLGIYRGMAVRLRARRDGHRPGFAVPKLLKAHGLKSRTWASGN